MIPAALAACLDRHAEVCALTPYKKVDSRFTHLYTRWVISEEDHSSDHQSIYMRYSKTEINFNDHHSIPMPCQVASDIMATFLDNPFQIEVSIK